MRYCCRNNPRFPTTTHTHTHTHTHTTHTTCTHTHTHTLSFNSLPLAHLCSVNQLHTPGSRRQREGERERGKEERKRENKNEKNGLLASGSTFQFKDILSFFS